MENNCKSKHPTYKILCRRVDSNHPGLPHTGVLHKRFWVNWNDITDKTEIEEVMTDTQVLEFWQKERKQRRKRIK